MPPAFVLSQDQTLKFVSHTQQARFENRRPARHELQGADTCTVKRNGYEWTCIIAARLWSLAGCGNRLRLTGIRSLKTPGPGAVAHMSLHQKSTMSKSQPTNEADTYRSPICTGGPVVRSELATDTTGAGKTGSAASVRGHIWTASDSVNGFLQFCCARAQTHGTPRVSGQRRG